MGNCSIASDRAPVVLVKKCMMGIETGKRDSKTNVEIPKFQLCLLVPLCLLVDRRNAPDPFNRVCPCAPPPPEGYIKSLNSQWKFTCPPPTCQSASVLPGTRLVVFRFVPTSLCAGSCAGSLLSACEIAALAVMAPLINHPVRLFIISRHLGCRWLLSPWHRGSWQEEA